MTSPQRWSTEELDNTRTRAFVIAILQERLDRLSNRQSPLGRKLQFSIEAVEKYMLPEHQFSTHPDGWEKIWDDRKYE